MTLSNRYAVITYNSSFPYYAEFDSLAEAEMFRAAERCDIGGHVLIYTMVEIIPGEWIIP